jgi:ABC-type antimicrobial peptide transport system permease subunit
MKDDYWSKYITAFYWVITTFSAIGYGEVIGNTKRELIFTMFVEMLGICFFGYIIGLFQSILTKIGSSQNAQAEQEDSISYWLMMMDKAV